VRPLTCKTPACDVDGTSVQYHSGGGVGSRHAVYKPDDVDGDEYGQQRRGADDAVGGYESSSTRLVDGRLRRRAAGVARGGGRRLAVVLVVPLVARQHHVARARNGRRLVRRLGQVDVQKLGQVRQREVFQRQV